MKLSLTFGGASTIQASSPSRTLAGELVRYGVLGRTSRGPLKVRAGALRFPDDLTRVKLTREHDRDASRGYLQALESSDTGIRASLRVSDGPEGDAAIQEAVDHTRDALSFDVIDATVDGDEITDALVIAIGQVGIPAYDDARIDTIAASAATPGGRRMKLSPDQAAIFAELSAKTDLTDQEKETLKALKALAAAPDIAPPAAAPPVVAAAAPVTASQATPPPADPAAPAAPGKVEVAASMPAIPSGLPGPAEAATTKPRGGAFGKFCEDMAAAFRGEGSQKVAGITAALSDVVYSANAGNIQQPDWSGELWSGLEFEAEFDDVFVPGTMTSLAGIGWRFTNKLAMADYAGDKAAIPTDTIATETSPWAGARQAVGVDIDRAYFDFPTPGFIESLFQQARESWAINMDSKKKAYILAKAKAALTDESNLASAAVGAQPTLLKAVAVALRALKRRRVGTADWVYVADDDFFTLLDTEVDKVLAYLKLFGIDPEKLRSSASLAAGTVYAGVKPAAKFRTLPGSPLRVDAQNLANGGVDEAFFGYWAIEEQHTRGIAKATFTPA
jgi:hypothetical protein